MDFTSIDVETANADLSSICQIGVVQFCDGIIVNRWNTFVNRNDYFDALNVSVHGITESDVSTAPTFAEIEALSTGRPRQISQMGNQYASCAN